MAGRRIYAGYYRRYDGKVVYVISLATDADTGEEMVIWTTYPFATVPRYYTSSKKSFCAFIEVNGERKAMHRSPIPERTRCNHGKKQTSILPLSSLYQRTGRKR